MDPKHLESIPLFASLSKKERKELGRYADEVDVKEGTELVKEGDWAYEFFAIEDGQAEVVRDGKHVADLGPGDFLGEMGAVDHGRRQASVVARSAMTLMVMTDRDFQRVMYEMPKVAEQIRNAIEERKAALPG